MQWRPKHSGTAFYSHMWEAETSIYQGQSGIHMRSKPVRAACKTYIKTFPWGNSFKKYHIYSVGHLWCALLHDMSVKGRRYLGRRGLLLPCRDLGVHLMSSESAQTTFPAELPRKSIKVLGKISINLEMLIY